MNKCIGLLLLAALALSGCQNNTAPHNSAAVTSAATQQAAGKATMQGSTPAVTPTPESGNAVAAGQPVNRHAATDTVAVAKKEKSHVASSVRQSMDQVKPSVAATVSELAAPANKGGTGASVPAKQDQATVAVATIMKQAEVAKPAVLRKNVAAVVPVAIGNAVKGKAIARKCQACHNFTDKRKVGPGFKGVFGRKAGKMTDMKYSASLASATWTWDAQKLALWVCNSKKAVKILTGDSSAKTKMPPQHICDPTKQADLIAFLKTL